MRTFIAKHFKTNLKVTFQYDLHEVLRIIEFEGEWNSDKIAKVLANATTSTAEMLERMKTQDLSRGWLYAELTDISFANFYKSYPRKEGPKMVTEKAWNKLGNVDKMEAILFISELKNQKSDGTAFPYPATYLNKKYWK